MADLIDREAAILTACETLCYCVPCGTPGAPAPKRCEKIVKAFGKIPAADVIARKRGHFTHLHLVYSDESKAMCSECGKIVSVGNFCSNCGADMRETEQ